MKSLEIIDQVSGFGFPEALRWHDGALWFSDMFRSRVMRWKPGSLPEVMLDQTQGGPEMPGGLGWSVDGNLIVVDCLKRLVLKRTPAGEISTLLDLSDKTDQPLNDMHVDSEGNCFVGGYGFDPESSEPSPSPIYKISPSGQLTVSPSDYVFPNGCERFGFRLAVAETFADRVSFFSPNLEHLSFSLFPAGSGPDGLSFGADGSLFVAAAFSGSLYKMAEGQEPEVIYELEQAQDAPGGNRGIFDCAVHPSQEFIAFSSASLDEEFGKTNDAGTISLLSLR